MKTIWKLCVVIILIGYTRNVSKFGEYWESITFELDIMDVLIYSSPFKIAKELYDLDNRDGQ